MIYKDRKRRLGDRYDGFKLRKVDTLFQLIPVIMRTRTDSLVYFEDEIDITEVEQFIREHRRAGMENLSMLQLFMSAIVRVFSLRPRLNRFVAGKKIYARNTLRISLAVKHSLTVSGEETTIMPEFEPDDSLYEVNKRFNESIQKEVESVKKAELKGNKTDLFTKAVGACPMFIKSSIVWAARNLDKIGLMPKMINRLSPFHSSAFITDMGSLGVGPVYHHLYEFGTCSLFFAMGKKETKNVLNDDGSVSKRKVIKIKIVADERICDGYYYASSMKMLKKLIKNPEQLLLKPESVVLDDGI